jgi:signal transduction histidine kinase
MHHRRHRGPWRGFRLGERWYERERVLERLENYQRDLEEELADVTDLIRRLREGEAPSGSAEPQTV